MAGHAQINELIESESMLLRRIRRLERRITQLEAEVSKLTARSSSDEQPDTENEGAT